MSEKKKQKKIEENLHSCDTNLYLKYTQDKNFKIDELEKKISVLEKKFKKDFFCLEFCVLILSFALAYVLIFLGISNILIWLALIVTLSYLLVEIFN